MAPAVSIVVTAFNRAEALRQTLDTLLSQTFGDFELLICDDASGDHTPEVAREYAARDARIAYHRNSRNLGMPGNLNEGIRRARAALVANLHDGDLYRADLLEKWTAALRDHPRAAFVFNQYAIVAGDGRVLNVYREDLPPAFPGSRLLEDIYFRRWRFDSPVWGTVMARRDAYLEAGLFDPRFGCIADVDMWMRLAEKYDVAYVSEPLISLIQPEELPSHFSIPRPLLRRIFREARSRHYPGRPLRALGEAARHLVFVGACSAWNGACRLKAALGGAATS